MNVDLGAFWIPTQSRHARCNATAALLSLLAFTVRAQVPRTIPFQLRLANPVGVIVNGPQSVTLALYDVSTSGTALWSETKTVTVSNGVLATALGDATPIPVTLAFDKQYFVGVKVAADAEMTPRLPLAAVPYALALPGVSAVNGNIGIGTATPGQKLTVAGGNLQIDRNQMLGFVPTDGFTYLGRPFGNYALGWFGNEVTGFTDAWLSGFGGITFFTQASGSVGPQVTIARYGNVGIGTTTPSEKLTLAGGNLQIDKGQVLGINPSDSFTYDGSTLGHYSLGWFPDSTNAGATTAWLSGFSGVKLFTEGTPRLAIDRAGNIGIGTSSPQAKLDVDGDVSTSGAILFSDGSSMDSAATPSFAVGIKGLLEFSQTADWTCPSGVTSISVEMWGGSGGGGGGGGGNTTVDGGGGGGGGAGAYVHAVIAVQPLQVYTLTVGSGGGPGGAGSGSSGGGNGGDGIDSTFKLKSNGALLAQALGGKRGSGGKAGSAGGVGGAGGTGGGGGTTAGIRRPGEAGTSGDDAAAGSAGGAAGVSASGTDITSGLTLSGGAGGDGASSPLAATAGDAGNAGDIIIYW